ncbi:BTAD domain-containing putative transcriptional regulator [Oryzobacter sp. R7]|uniref:nSTAND1 domain-containing NTPase n=1 Tax=Oryzobacter faecalis TaxID=3388656 RepID=UPI00398CECAE
MRIRVLGPLLVDDRAALSPRDTVVLEALVAESGRPLGTDRLAEAMWGDERPESWAKLIPSSVLRIRKVLGGPAIETTPHGYRLALGGEAVDAVRFERLVDRGHQLLAIGEPDRARHVLREALALWRGRPLAELEDWEPGRAAADRLVEMRREAEETVIEAGLRAGVHTEAVAEARLRVTEEPLRERRWSLLALAQYLSGDAAAALATLRRARARLADELGLDPGPDLEELEQAMLRRDPSLVTRVALPDADPTSPYPGLRSFDVDDGEFYFGRDGEVRQCLGRLQDTGCVVVVGASGCGKSSLLRAGVAAALRRDGEKVVVLGPGSDPVGTLRELTGSGFAGTLVVDPLDEVLVACGPDGRRELTTLLVELSRWWGLAMSIRADHLADVADEPALARLVERGTYLLGPMTEEGMRDAIVRPAAAAALLLEPGLVDLLVTEVTGAPGALPLMAHALHQTWERREGRTLTVDGYHASGGISGAVAQTAERVYEDLSVDDRSALRDLLGRLVTVAPDGTPVRVWAPVTQLAPGEGGDLVEVLVRERLLTRDNGVVAVAHEALARFWPRLAGWLEDDVEGRRMLRHLTDAADSWEALGRVDSELYRGVRLSRALEWRRTSGVRLTSVETQFLRASEQRADAERRHEALAARRRRRQVRTVRGLVVTSAALVVVLAAAASFGLRQRDLAAEASVVSRVNAAVAAAYESSDPVVAALAGVEAVRLRDDARSRTALHDALDRWPALLASVVVSGAVSLSVGDGGTVALGHGSRLTLHDPASLAQVAEVPGKAPVVHLLSGEREVLIGTAESELVVLDLSARTRTSLLGSAPGDLARVTASADGRVRAGEHYDWRDEKSAVHVWRGRELVRSLPRRGLAGLLVTPDGSTLVVRHRSPAALSVVDVATGRELVTRTGADLGLGESPSPEDRPPMAVSPDGRLVAVGVGADVLVLDARTLAVRWRADSPSGAVLTLAFSPDGALLVGGSDAGAATVWTVGGALREELAGPSRTVTGLGVSPDGRTLYTLAADGRLSAWDLGGDRRSVQLLVPPDEGVTDLVAEVSPSGRAVAFVVPEQGVRTRPLRIVDLERGRTLEGAVASRGDRIVAWQPGEGGLLATHTDRRVQVWDWRRGVAVAERDVGAVAAITWTPDGRRIVVGGPDGTVHQVDAGTLLPVGARGRVDGDVLDLEPAGAERVLTLSSSYSVDLYRVVDLTDGSTSTPQAPGLWVTALDVSPDGRLLALGSIEGDVGVAEAGTGDWVVEPRRVHTGAVLGVEFSADGSLLASSSADGRVRLWDGRSGDPRGSLSVAPAGVASYVTFVDDGHTLLVAGGDGSVRRWDLRVDTWVRLACERAGRDLTAGEWADVFGAGQPYRRTCPAAAP